MRKVSGKTELGRATAPNLDGETIHKVKSRRVKQSHLDDETIQVESRRVFPIAGASRFLPTPWW